MFEQQVLWLHCLPVPLGYLPLSLERSTNYTRGDTAISLCAQFGFAAPPDVIQLGRHMLTSIKKGLCRPSHRAFAIMAVKGGEPWKTEDGWGLPVPYLPLE